MNWKVGLPVALFTLVAPVVPIAYANVTAPMTQNQMAIVSNAKQAADNAVVKQIEATNTTVSGNYFKIQELIAAGSTQEGVPYQLNHQVAFHGFDCSNFVAWCYKQVGVTFSGSSEWQRYNLGTPVPLSQIKPGDVLFFATANNKTGGGHCGIYIGNGNVIQCGGGWGKVCVEPLKGTWLGRNLVYARRVLNT